ncbi:hypothetical protein [Oceanobacillus neutriphilus]|uniref:DUF2178 domain-containing protein n=1 Tax=Oceanobacillus neutriphilus TaxID=531815 RepID=A0ABQ2NWD9_9BACI|nr:hypothetical protein [Oceanobacillus neutriphilus]GGP12134.1 hypothetical protein GCM10011346_26920 [Oceanobacillus neutriphilus]
MSSFLKKLERQLTLPFFTPTIDSYLALGFAFAGSFAVSFIRGIIPLWQLVLYAVILLIIITPILRMIGNKWREKKGIKEEDLKPNKLVDHIVLNVLLGFTVVCFVIALIINLLAESFNWAWIGFHVFAILFVYLVRFIHFKRLEKS